MLNSFRPFFIYLFFHLNSVMFFKFLLRNICCPILKTGNSVGYPKMVTLLADNQSVSMRLVPSSNRANRQSHDGTVNITLLHAKM